MNIVANSGNACKVVNAIALALDLEVKRAGIEESLKLGGSVGKGEFSGYTFPDGISLLVMKATLKKNLELTFEGCHSPPMLFLYNVEGRIRHVLDDDNSRYQLQKMNGSISSCRFNKDQRLVFPVGEKLDMVVVMLNRIQYLSKVDHMLRLTPPRLKDVLMDVQGDQTFLYEFTSSINIYRVLEQVINCPFRALVKATYLEAKVLELMALQFRFYIRDTSPSNQFVNIRADDLERLMKARDIIDANLTNPLTIPELAKRIGVNVNKLKRGFKQVFEITINKYVTQQRLERARDLLLEGRLTVAEVCHEIGYDNGSYFARIFKKRFGKHPSQVLRDLQLNVEDHINENERAESK